MDDRDFFAGMAMQAFLIRDNSVPRSRGFCFDGKQMAAASYDAANFMVEEKFKREIPKEKPLPTKPSFDNSKQ